MTTYQLYYNPRWPPLQVKTGSILKTANTKFLLDLIFDNLITSSTIRIITTTFYDLELQSTSNIYPLMYLSQAAVFKRNIQNQICSKNKSVVKFSYY